MHSQMDLLQPSLLNQSGISKTIAQISGISECASANLHAVKKIQWSQYFTPMEVAHQMVEMNDYTDGLLGDTGAGTGILGATVLSTRLASTDCVKPMSLRAYEIDTEIHSEFIKTLQTVCKQAEESGLPAPSVNLLGDLTDDAEAIVNNNPSLY